MLGFLFGVGVFLLPFIFWPWSAIPYEVPRVLFLWRWVEVLVMALTLVQFRKPQPYRFDGRVFSLLVGFGAVAVLATLFGVDPLKSWWGNVYRSDGLLTLLHLMALSCVLMVVSTPDLKKWGLRAALLASAIITVLTLFEAAVYQAIPAGWSFQQANFLAGYLLVTLPLWGVVMSHKNWGRPVGLIGGGLQILAVLLTQSLGAIFGLAVLTVSWWLLRRNYWRALMPVLLGSVVIFWAAASWYQHSLRTYEGRDRILAKLSLSVAAKPLLGWGWANVDYAFKEYDWQIVNDNDVYIDKAHSVWLEVLVTTGLIGALVYVLLVSRVGWQLRQLMASAKTAEQRHEWLILTLIFVLWLYHAQTNVVSIAEEVWFWIVIGLVGSKNR